MRYVALAIAALVFCPAASAATQPDLDRQLSLAGKPALLACAGSREEWHALQRKHNLAPPYAERWGFAYINGGTAYMAPQLCTALRRGLRADPWMIAWAADVFAHEAAHLRGVSNEAAAEACARRDLPHVLHALYGVRYGTKIMRQLTRRAMWWRSGMPREYQGGTC